MVDRREATVKPIAGEWVLNGEQGLALVKRVPRDSSRGAGELTRRLSNRLH